MVPSLFKHRGSYSSSSSSSFSSSPLLCSSHNDNDRQVYIEGRIFPISPANYKNSPPVTNDYVRLPPFFFPVLSVRLCV